MCYLKFVPVENHRSNENIVDKDVWVNFTAQSGFICLHFRF
mgnify:FL=1